MKLAFRLQSILFVLTILCLSRLTLATELIQFSRVQAGVSTLARQQSIQQNLTNQDHVIEFTATGFTPQSLSIQVGDRVIWRNTTDTILSLHSGMPPKLFLPLLTTGVASVRSANQEPETSQPSKQETFAAQLAPGEEFAHQFNIVGPLTILTVNSTTATQCSVQSPSS